MIPHPRDAAAEYGHIVKPDPTTPGRWTCTRCPATVTAGGGAQPAGDAVRERCPEEATVNPIIDDGDWD